MKDKYPSDFKINQVSKVDLSRKRSRPNSDASTIESHGSTTGGSLGGRGSGGPAEKKDGLDSYTRSILFLLCFIGLTIEHGKNGAFFLDSVNMEVFA